MAIFELKRDVKLQLTNFINFALKIVRFGHQSADRTAAKCVSQEHL